MPLFYRARNGGLGFVVDHTANCQQSYTYIPPTPHVQRSYSTWTPDLHLQWPPLSSAIWSLAGLFRLHQTSLKIFPHQKKLPSWVPGISLSRWGTRPGFVFDHRSRSSCAFPVWIPTCSVSEQGGLALSVPPIHDLDERWGAWFRPRLALGSLQQVGAEEVLGSVYTTWGWSIWTLWLLINAPHCTLALHIGIAPNWTELFPFKEGCEGLCWRWGFCVDVFLLLRCSPECCQRCGLSQWKGEFPSLMSLHLFLYLTWPWWKACEPLQLFVFPFLSIFQPLPFICTSL